MMFPFEEHLRCIDSLINVKAEDRQPYTTLFEEVKAWLMQEMARVDPVFKRLYRGTSLFGSYTNGVRLLKPNEFDILFVLDLPSESVLELDDDRPGFVHVDLAQALDDLEDDPNQEDVYETLSQLVDNNNGYLKRNNFQRWISNIIKEVFDTPTSRFYGVDLINMGYKKNAVAHTIYAAQEYYPYKKIYIDFVPAIRFVPAINWMRKHKYLYDYYCSYFAVPKKAPNPNKNLQTNLYTFLMVNPMAEHELLWDKQNLKTVFRLLKSLRDCYGLHRLESYFLTTLFLWEVNRHEQHFWENSVCSIFLEMLYKLCDYFNKRNMPYFWVKGCNLLDMLKPAEITEYANTLTSVYRTLNSYQHQPLLSFGRTASYFDLPESDSE